MGPSHGQGREIEETNITRCQVLQQPGEDSPAFHKLWNIIRLSLKFRSLKALLNSFRAFTDVYDPAWVENRYRHPVLGGCPDLRVGVVIMSSGVAQLCTIKFGLQAFSVTKRGRQARKLKEN